MKINETVQFDHIVVGSGLAGLSSALHLARSGRSVAVLTKREIYECNSRLAQGGVACVMDRLDSFDEHVKDTLTAGAGLCDIGAVRAIVEARLNEPAGFASEIRALVWLLLIRLHRIFRLETPPPVLSGSSRLMPALHYIARHIHEEVEIPQLAALCSTSESNFRKLFHRAFGCAPKTYLGRMRLKSAAVMLETGSLPVLEIAMRCGFRSLSNFNRQFRFCYGVSPSAFRAAHNG